MPGMLYYGILHQCSGCSFLIGGVCWDMYRCTCSVSDHYHNLCISTASKHECVTGEYQYTDRSASVGLIV